MSDKNLGNIDTGVDGEPLQVVDSSSSSDSEWYFADGVKGVGTRPDYLEQKYKTVADQAKAYKEAQKLIGTSLTAPDSYEFGDLSESIDQDNPYIKEFVNFAKENKFQQEQFSKTLKTLVDYNKSKQPDVNEEISKLGSDGAQKVTTVQNWVKNNLSKESVSALSQLPVKAEVVKMLDEIRQLHTAAIAKVPSNVDDMSNFSVLTKEDVELEMAQNYKRYQEDAKYRAQISAKFAQVVGD